MILSRLFKKTLLTIIILFGVISGLISLFAALTLKNQLTFEYQSKARAIAQSISSSSLELFIDKDAITIQSLIDQFLDLEGVSYVFVTSEAGEVVAHTFVPLIPRVLGEYANQIIERNERHQEPIIRFFSLPGRGDVLNVTTPILSGTAGFVHIGMDMGLIRSIIWRAIYRIQMITLVVFALSAIAAYFLINRISQPLTALTEYSKKLARQNFDAPMTIRSKDEVGALARTMQGMAQEISQLVTGLENEVDKATRDLQDALAYLTVVLDNLADGLLVASSDGRIILNNPAMASMLGMPEDTDLAGRWCRDLIGKDLAVFMLNDARSKQTSLHENTQIKRTEMVVDRTDGSSFPAELSVSTVQLKGRRSFIGILRNITERKMHEQQLEKAHDDLERRVLLRTEELSMANLMLKRQIVKKQQAEDALAAEKELLTVTLRSIGDGVIATDINGKIILMNKIAEELTGWPQHEALDKPLKQVFHVVDEATGDPLPYPALATLEQGRILEIEEGALLLARDGRKIEIGDSMAPIYDRNSEVIGSVVVFRDVSQQRKQEQERLRSEKLESLGVLAGGIAHDFNNILTSILNNIILARITGPADSSMNSKLRQAEDGTLRAKQLTQQLLTFSRGGVPVRESTSIADLIVDSSTFALRGSNVKCEFTVPDDLWPADVDYGQIVQVMDNLVINADQAMPEGGTIHIALENVTIDNNTPAQPLEPGRYVRIEVRDEGTGIPPDTLDHIFDPYFTTKDTGSGLGLATTYSIIRNHGGHVEVHSTPGQGTSFRIFLPAASQPPAERRSEPEGAVKGHGHLLIMDDEQSVRDILCETLEFLGYTVDFARNGQEALDLYQERMAKEGPYDAVIMDLTIPGGMGGKEAIQKLLRIDPHARAIVSSGYSQDPVMAHYADHGFKNVLMKPYTVDEVSRKLNDLLRKQ